ncbi:MAG: hypothetical protein AVO38_16115 [delta proteobacterium ML8_D]|jgi:hypothetical protein|nr:MAG: hypothetical protein AVO38_16115 [delta proteobacterium ML8_D]
MIRRIVILSVVLLLVGAVNASAKWWIFGQSQEEVATRYIYINDISYDELGDSVTFYRDVLPKGEVRITGRGQAGKGVIGTVQISTDDGLSWNRAQLASNGSFEFRFRPVVGETYTLKIKVLDTAGKSNDVEETRKELTVSGRNIHTLIQETLDGMINAYRTESAREFMRYVDPEFTGDAFILESAIRKDFTALDQIDMYYTFNNIATGANGKVFASITFSRQVVASKSGQILQDKGQTEFTFSLEGNKALVYSMKNPLIFGLSEAEDVATGLVNSPTSEGNLMINPGGNAEISDLDEISDVTDAPVTPSVTSSVPTPTNLSSYDFTSHHTCSFRFEFPINSMETDLSNTYDIILEESLSPSGPWQEVFREAFYDPTFFNIGTTNIGSYQGLLYYRAIVEEQATDQQSLPSNTVVIDNH